MPRKTSSVFERLSLPGGAPSRSLDVPKKLDASSSPAKDQDGSVSVMESMSTKSVQYDRNTRNEPIFKAHRAKKIPPVLRHQTVARVESPLSSYPSEKTQRSKTNEFKSSIKDRGYRDCRKNSSEGRKRQLAPRILFSDAYPKTRATRVSSRHSKSKIGSNSEKNREKGCVKVSLPREFPPKDNSSVLARYVASSG